MAVTATTKPEEFAKFISLLPMNPYLIPLKRESKDPDIHEGESWKDPKYRLTTEQAYVRLCTGLNVGVVACEGLVMFDHDNPERYTFLKETLTVKTRNNGLHKFFLNNGTVKNAVGKGEHANCGEVRASWQYVVCAGSFVPPDSPDGDGVYKVIVEHEPVTLSATELPSEFQPSATANADVECTLAEIHPPYKNRNGLTLEEIRAREPKLDKLLKNDNSDYPSASEADMATLSKLLFYEYTLQEAVALLMLFRDREKLRRADYLQATLSKIRVTETYTQQAVGKEEDAPDMKATLDSLHLQFMFKTPTDIEEIYVYNDGIYEPAEHKIEKMLEELHRHKITSHYVSEALDHIRRASYVDRSEFNKSSVIVPVENGLLNLSTLKLEPFNPDKIFTYKLNAAHKPEAKCPQWEAFIKEVVDAEDLPFLQEYMGYSLVSGMPYHKVIWLYGNGHNGKGTTIRTLQALFGKDNCSNLELEDFNGDRRFRIANLCGKAINVSSEPATNRILQTPTLKKITGEDMIDAEIKNKQKPLRFLNKAKLYIMGNRFPKVNDDTPAFWMRIGFVNYPKAYLREKAIPDIEHCWTKNPEEMSGFLNWMIDGLARLLENGTFTASKTTEQTKIQFKRASDTALAFLDEQTEPFPNSYVTRAELYDHYKAYCETYGIIVDDERAFTAKLRQRPQVRSGKKRIEGKVERVWIGLKAKPLKTDEELEEAQRKKKRKKKEEQPNTDLTDYTKSEADEAPVSPPQNSENQKEVVEERKKNIETPAPSAPCAPPRNRAVDCAICLKPLPPDLYDCTTYHEHQVHVTCFLRVKDSEAV